MFEASTNQRMRFSSQTWECKPQTPCELGRLLYLKHQTEGSGLERGEIFCFSNWRWQFSRQLSWNNQGFLDHHFQYSNPLGTSSITIYGYLKRKPFSGSTRLFPEKLHQVLGVWPNWELADAVRKYMHFLSFVMWKQGISIWPHLDLCPNFFLSHPFIHSTKIKVVIHVHS